MNEINFKQHLQRYPYIGCKLCTHQYKCVGTKNSSFTEEHVSRNFGIRAKGAKNKMEANIYINVPLLGSLFRFYAE